MIAKELDDFTSTDKFFVAGRKAEEQMAFYLKRAFGETPHIRVLNNVRLERNGDVAQVDHLLLHKYGVTIIESKSVTTLVEVNAEDEWRRAFGGRWSGMPSPVLQAKRQGEFLKRYLTAHDTELLDKMIFGLVQTGFGAMALDVIVAISDTGQIKRAHKNHAPEVMKADQVVDRVRALLKHYDHLVSPLNLILKDIKDAPRTFNDKELYRITAFLRNHHKPLAAVVLVQDEPAATPAAVVPTLLPAASAPPTVVPANPPLPTASYVCRHCRSSDVAVAYGKYGYYFKCSACEKNTPIAEVCSSCNSKARVRKDRETFYAECQSCNMSRAFFINPG